MSNCPSWDQHTALQHWLISRWYNSTASPHQRSLKSDLYLLSQINEVVNYLMMFDASSASESKQYLLARITHASASSILTRERWSELRTEPSKNSTWVKWRLKRASNSKFGGTLKRFSFITIEYNKKTKLSEDFIW